jgi:cardiolipin synthase
MNARGTSSRRGWAWTVSAGAFVLFLAALLFVNVTSPEHRVERPLAHRYGVDDPQFGRELAAMLGPPILGGNRVTHFENGVEIFPPMLAAIHAARRSIDFETYVYWEGAVGRRFAEALAGRARAGVAVHVLLDWVGSQRMERALLEELTAAGAHVERYHPLHWYTLARLNNRTHRKLLVVDGRVGFTGGVGIGDPWDGDATPPDHYRDSHYRVEGPAVAQMQAAFVDIWIKTTGEVLQGEAYFPDLPPVGTSRAQLFTSSPSGGADSMALMYLLSIAAAERTIDLSAAYFLPDPLTRRELDDALRRGVRVRILTPGPQVDAELIRDASRASWGELLEAGAEIYVFQPTLFHCKLLVVDRRLVSVGSTNFDNRSFRLNDEANLNVYDPDLAETLTEVFERDLAQARRIALAEWRNRPWRERVLERLSALLSPEL